MINTLNITSSYAGDACKKEAVGYHGSHYWSRLLPLHMCGDDPPIHLKEFHVLLISLRLWGSSWSGQSVELFCDNTATVEVCVNQKPKDPTMAKLLREFLLLVVKFKCHPVVKKISTTDNWIADFLSREFPPKITWIFSTHRMSPMTKVDIPDHQFIFSASW